MKKIWDFIQKGFDVIGHITIIVIQYVIMAAFLLGIPFACCSSIYRSHKENEQQDLVNKTNLYDKKEIEIINLKYINTDNTINSVELNIFARLKDGQSIFWRQKIDPTKPTPIVGDRWTLAVVPAYSGGKFLLDQKLP